MCLFSIETQFFPFASFAGMHRFPAKLFAEDFSVLLVGEHEHLVVFAPPSNGVSVPGKRKPPVSAKFPELMKVLARALVFRKSDPMWKIIVRCPEYPTIGAHYR
jgi:hypothetical protein